MHKRALGIIRTHMLDATNQANDQPAPPRVPPQSLIYFEEKFLQPHSPSSWQRASGGTLRKKEREQIWVIPGPTAVLITPFQLPLKTLIKGREAVLLAESEHGASAFLRSPVAGTLSYLALSPSTESEVQILYLSIISLFFCKLSNFLIIYVSPQHPLMLWSHGASVRELRGQPVWALFCLVILLFGFLLMWASQESQAQGFETQNLACFMTIQTPKWIVHHLKSKVVWLSG